MAVDYVLEDLMGKLGKYTNSKVQVNCRRVVYKQYK